MPRVSALQHFAPTCAIKLHVRFSIRTEFIDGVSPFNDEIGRDVKSIYGPTVRAGRGLVSARPLQMQKRGS